MADEKKRDDDPVLPSVAPQMAMFAGVGVAVHLAKNKGEDRPMKAIRRAEEMRVKGAKRSDIHRETSKMLEATPYAGVTYGADKQPRFEIDDSMASARVAGVPAGGKAFLADALHHPELYDAVPSAKHLTVQRSPTNDSGITGSGLVVGDQHFGGRIGGREIMKKSAKGPMLHEVQHFVQDIEGFAEGGTPKDFAKQYPNNPEKQKTAYMMLAGEQEAEMTRKRADMTAAERRATMPKPDVPYEHQIVQFDARAKAKIDMTSVTDSARAAYRALMNRDVADGKTIRFRKVDPSAVQSDAQTFQFKSGGDQAGVTDRLKGVKTWDPVAAGKTVIWERADGQMFIGDGHQRLGLAKRLQGAGQNVELDAYVMRERDGWSPRDVRAYAAVKNMKEGSGTSLDMAKVVRERPDLINDSLPLSDGKVRDAIALSKLSPDAFKMVVGGVIKPEHAAAVGSAVGDTSRHAGLLTEMAKAEVASAQQARLYVGQAMASGTYQETTGSLFGEETKVRSLLAERTKVLDKAIQSLKSDKKIFGLLEREAGQIEAAGNKLAHDVNAARAEGAGRTAELVERLALNRGPVSEMLDRAAAGVAEGKTPSVAAREFVRSVHDTLKTGGMAGLTGDAPKPVVDPNQVNMFGGTGERPGWSDEARQASAESRAENAKGPKMKKPRAPKTKAMMDSELPPRLGKGKTSPAAAAKWERELRAVPQDDAEKRLLERKKGERVGQSKRAKAMIGDDGKKYRETFARDPNGKQRNTKGELLPGRLSDAAKRNIDRLEALGYQPFRDAAKALNIDASGGNSEIRARLEQAAPFDFTGRLEEVTSKFTAGARAKAEGDLKALVAKTGAPAGAQAKAVAAGMAEHDRLDTALMKGRPGWSDAARAASADVRAADAKPAKEPKPLMKDADVKHLLKQGLVTREDVKSSKTMSELKDKARGSAANKLRDRGMLDAGVKGDQVIEEWVNSGKPKTVDAKAYDMVKDSVSPVESPERLAERERIANGTKRIGDTYKAPAKPPEPTHNSFTSGLKPAAAAKAKSALEMQVRHNGKEVLSRAALVEREVANGATVQTMKIGGKDQSVLMGKDGAFLDARNITKTGLDYAAHLTAKATSGLRGTQNAANLEAIIANKKANANPDLAGAAKSAGVKDLHGQMQEVFKPAAAPAVPHQMTPQGQADRFVNRMIAAGSTKSPEVLKAEFAAKSAAKPAGRGRKALGLLMPVAIGTAMLAASNQAKAAGADARGQSKEAVKAGVESGAVMAGFTIGAGVAIKGLVRAGMTVAKAAPVVQGAFMAYGAISEGIHAYKEGGSAKDVALAAGKGAWDMSLPGMVVNTTKDAAAAIKERRDLAATPHVAGLQRFNKVAADYKAKAEAARSPMVEPVEPSDGDNRPRGWANAKVQAAAQAAKGRQFSGVFKDGHLQ